jgi:hypothetical protein
MTLATHRPRGVGEILDATFTFYRANFSPIVIAAMIVVAPSALIQAMVPREFGGIVSILGNLILPIGLGAITAIVAAAVERSEVLSVGDAFRSATSRAGSLIAAQIASGIMVFIGFVLLIVPGVIAIAWTALCIPVVMIEQLGYSKAIDRSRALVRGKWMYVLGTLLLSWALTLVLMIGAGAISGLLGSGDRMMNLVLQMLFGVVVPVPAIAMTLLYYDLRVRNEGADIDAMLSELPASVPSP